jgi:hypothetical protein
MQIIKNNPYRTIGLLAGASLKDQTRQANRLKQYVEAEQEVTDDFSFPVLGNIYRTINSIGDAVSKLNLNNDRINAALFWFYNGSHIDEASFDSLKDNNLQEAVNIWERRTASGEISHNNHSAFLNLSTIKLLSAFNNGTINPAILEEGITLKLKFIESDFLHEFRAKIADETYRVNKNELELYFLNQVQTEVEKSSGLSPQKLLEIINKQSFSAKEEFLSKFIQKPIEQIQRMIEASKAKIKTKKDVIIAGETLYKEARPLLETLKSAIGTSNIKFQTVCDKASDEILQCGIQLFNDYRDNDNYDPAPPAMELLKKAKLLAVGKVAKQRYEDNSQSLQEWIDDKPNRDIEKKVGKDIEFIVEQLNLAASTLKNKGEYPEGYNDPYSKLPLHEQPHNRRLAKSKQHAPFEVHVSAATWATRDPLGRNPNNANFFRLAKDIVEESKLKLENIKNTLGSTNEIYLKLSNDLASIALACLIEYVNNSGNPTLGISPSVGEHQIKAMNAIGELEMDMTLRKRYNEQKQSLLRLQQSVQSRSSGKPTGGGGCYIATMAYGDYDHPQVMILRGFRDGVLDKSAIGKSFIKFYYKFSPCLVEILKNHKGINVLIRKALDQFIKLIRR